MKLGFFLGDAEQIGKQTKLGVDSDAMQRDEERANIFSGDLRLHFGDIIAGIAIFAINILGRATVSQIEAASACIHDKSNPGMAQATPILD